VVEKAPVIAVPEVKVSEPLPERVVEAVVAAPEEAAPQVLPAAIEERDPVEQPRLTEYRFLLRRGTLVSLGLPDDLTRREAERLSRWIDTFVIDSDSDAV